MCLEGTQRALAAWWNVFQAIKLKFWILFCFQKWYFGSHFMYALRKSILFNIWFNMFQQPAKCWYVLYKGLCFIFSIKLYLLFLWKLIYFILFVVNFPRNFMAILISSDIPLGDLYTQLYKCNKMHIFLSTF